MLFKILENPQANTCAEVSFYLKETLRQVLSCKFCKVSAPFWQNSCRRLLLLRYFLLQLHLIFLCKQVCFDFITVKRAFYYITPLMPLYFHSSLRKMDAFAPKFNFGRLVTTALFNYWISNFRTSVYQNVNIMYGLVDCVHNRNLCKEIIKLYPSTFRVNKFTEFFKSIIGIGYWAIVRQNLGIVLFWLFFLRQWFRHFY